MTTSNKSVFDQPDAGTITHDETPPRFTNPQDDRGFFGHPRGLSTLFFTEMWERFSYYGLRPLLVLFMTAAITSGGFGFERTQASSIVGIYAASVYLASLPGGWVADRILGLRRAIFAGVSPSSRRSSTMKPERARGRTSITSPSFGVNASAASTGASKPYVAIS